MRVLLLSSEFPPGPGGIGTHAFELARHLARRGWRVRAAVVQDYADDSVVDAWNAERSFEVVRLERGRFAPLEPLRRLRALRRAAAEFGPDVVVATGERMLWLAPWVVRAAARTGAPPPWLAVAHGTEFGAPGSWRARLTKRAMAGSRHGAKAVVSVSEHTRGFVHRCGIRVPVDEVIPNGADAERFAPAEPAALEAMRTRFGLEPPAEGASPPPLLLTVGHLSPRKGQDLVVRALPALVARHPDLVYLALGMPTERSALEALASELGVSANVRFPGVADAADVVAAMTAADVFVMTSRHTGGDFEGYGIAVIEAALCDTPAVVAGGSGLAEAVVDGVTGVVVPPEDPDALAAALGELLDDPSRLERLGTAARARAASEGTWAHRMAAYDGLLRRVAGSAELTRPVEASRGWSSR